MLFYVVSTFIYYISYKYIQEAQVNIDLIDAIDIINHYVIHCYKFHYYSFSLFPYL